MSATGYEKLLAVAVLAISGCSQSPVSTTPTDNPNFKIDTLFSRDGCTVYRFYDNGRNHYYANCSGSLSHTYSCGKRCESDEVTPTVGAP